ncbi:MAG: hypothetical protein H6657_03555 [Ardenticatenaceae bacterium]|nr:hypothetical protein [Ardenticatenaceae bacterium]
MPRRKNSEKMFREVWNPTREEVLRWAYTPNVYTPTQDFELAVYTPELHDLILQCASDQACPHQDFFLSCLYVLVGDALRSKWKVFSETLIINLIMKGKQSPTLAVQMWAKRAEDLIAKPTLYNYDQWGLGSSYVYEARQKKVS